MTATNTAFGAARTIYGPQFNPQITLKALSFFGGGDLGKLPQDMKERLASAARAVDLDNLPEITALKEPDAARGGGRGR